mgnify:CR=1 FL=1
MAKKIVIVGGGVGGLTAGVYARKAGFDAVIVEKNKTPGGELTGWEREGYTIDNCVHWMMGAKPGTALHEIWRETGALSEGVEVIGSAKMYTSELDGQRLTLWQDMEKTRREMKALSPEDADEIDALMEAVKIAQKVQIPAEKPAELMNPVDLIKMSLTMGGALKLFKMYAGTDTRDLANRFKHPLIRCLISDFCPPDSLGQSFPMAYGNFVSGDGGVPRGGSRAMALRMADRFLRLGGTLRTGVSAEKLIHENGRASALRLENGEKIAGDYFVMACDAEQTFNRLLTPDFMPPALKEMYDHPNDYLIYGMFQTAFAVDCAQDALQGEWMTDCEELVLAPFASNRLTVKNFAYEPSFAPAGKQILQTMQGLLACGYDYWLKLYGDKAAYEAKKAEWAEKTRLYLEARIPAYKGKLRLLDVWTPMTYRKWCNAHKGYNQAFVVSKRGMKNPYPPAKIPGLENALLAGQWIVPPGGLPGAATTGKFAIQRILKIEGKPLKI